MSSNAVNLPLTQEHTQHARPARSNDDISSIYLYKNDPKVINRGVNIMNVKHAQGGFLPMLTDDSYKERKFDNLSYNYEAKFDHGSRPMHKTTFNLTQTNHNDNLTHNKIVYRGFQLRPEYMPTQGEDQFKHHFDISMNHPRNFTTHYNSQFYTKNDDKEYQTSFDLMPKYSLPKKVYQLEKDGEVKQYKNRQSNIGEALKPNDDDTTYWTQYKRTHDILGATRGPGVPREYPDRPGYNVLTGEQLSKPSWSINSNYNRISGNVILNTARKANPNILN